MPEPAYDFVRHEWTPRCPHGDLCSGCDARGYCTRMEQIERLIDHPVQDALSEEAFRFELTNFRIASEQGECRAARRKLEVSYATLASRLETAEKALQESEAERDGLVEHLREIFELSKAWNNRDGFNGVEINDLAESAIRGVTCDSL